VLGRILCLTHHDPTNAAVGRSCTLTRDLESELYLARMVAGRLRVESIRVSDDVSIDDLQDDDVDLALASAISTLMDRLIVDVCRIAHDLAVTMLVMPGYLARPALVLAEQLRIPVLVARPAQGEDVVVVATDLADRGHPVLAAGHDLASRMKASVVAVHNAPRTVDRDQVGHKLRAAASRFGSNKTIVAAHRSTTYAILDHARAHAADVIVVGLRSRSWLRRQLETGIPERIAREAARSVLVVPIRDRKT
jgi:nucleotide-binding universal stress UspA family protein